MKKMAAIFAILILAVMGILWAAGVFDGKLSTSASEAEFFVTGSLEVIITLVLISVLILLLVCLLSVLTAFIARKARAQHRLIKQMSQMFSETKTSTTEMRELMAFWKETIASLDSIMKVK